jgi:hypothetical protein
MFTSSKTLVSTCQTTERLNQEARRVKQYLHLLLSKSISRSEYPSKVLFGLFTDKLKTA